MRVLRISMINARAIEINRVLLASCAVCDVTESEKRRRSREAWGYDGAIHGVSNLFIVVTHRIKRF